MACQHFLSLLDLSSEQLNALVYRAIELKQQPVSNRFAGRVLGMVFEKSSTRTRISFEAGMAQMGGSAIFLSPRDTQLGRGEPIQDSARVISSMVDVVMVRTFEQATIETFAAYSSVPVINALTDSFHPCQLLADIQTFVELRGDIKGKTVAWIGDGNNMCNSYINAARQFDFSLQIATPAGYEPMQQLLEANSDRVTLGTSAAAAASGADLVVTDVWASMGQEQEQAQRVEAFKDFQVNHALMEQANADALFMHCLPAHRGEEVSAELLEDEKTSVVWQEAENRLHAQKALLELLLAQ